MKSKLSIRRVTAVILMLMLLWFVPKTVICQGIVTDGHLSYISQYIFFPDGNLGGIEITFTNEFFDDYGDEPDYETFDLSVTPVCLAQKKPGGDLTTLIRISTGLLERKPVGSSIIVIGSAAIKDYLIEQGHTTIDDAASSIKFYEYDFDFTGRDYIEYCLEMSSNFFSTVDFIGDSQNHPETPWTHNGVSTFGQNIQKKQGMKGILPNEVWTQTSISKYFETVTKNDRLYGFGDDNPFPIIDSLMPEFVSSISDGAIDVPVTIQPKFTFSETVYTVSAKELTDSYAASVIKLSSAQEQAFTAAVNSDKTIITVNPAELLAYNAEYVLTIEGVEDSVGNTIDKRVIRFKTEKRTSVGLIDENIQDWGENSTYGNYNQTISAGVVALTDCAILPQATGDGECSSGRIVLKANTGILTLPQVESVSTVSLGIMSTAAGQSVTLQYFDQTWHDIVTFTGIGTSGEKHTHEVNFNHPTTLRLVSPSSTIYIHDILVKSYVYNDQEPPVVTFDPLNGASNIALTHTPIITFNEPIQRLDNAILTNDNVASIVELTKGGVGVPFTASISAEKKLITITPESQFDEVADYTITVAQVKDISGNISQQASTTFRTVDITSPTLSITPANGVAEVLQDTKIKITSNESLCKVDGSTLDNNNIATLITFTAQSTNIPFTATINPTKDTIEITPSTRLNHSTTYSVVLTNVADSSKNIANISTTFTTFKAPKIAFFPTQNAYNVSVEAKLTISSTKTIFMSDGNELQNSNIKSLISLVNSQGDNVPFTAEINFAKTQITITPDATFQPNSLYELGFNEVKDEQSNIIEATTIRFVTEVDMLVCGFEDPSKWVSATGDHSDIITFHQHKYIDTDIGLNFSGENIRQSAVSGAGFWFGNYSLTQGMFNASLTAHIPDNGVGNFKFKVRCHGGPFSYRAIVQYSVDSGATWTQLPVVLDSTYFFADNTWKTFHGTVNSPNNNIMIKILKTPDRVNNRVNHLLYFDDFAYSPYSTPVELRKVSISHSGAIANCSTTPGDSAFVGRKVVYNISEIETTYHQMTVEAKKDDSTLLALNTIIPNAKYSFTMPNQDVFITTKFYNLVSVKPVTNGHATVTVSKNLAIADVDTIIIDVANIADGKRVSAVSVQRNSGVDIDVTTVISGSQYSFVMPTDSVSVNVILEDILHNVVVALEPQGSGEVVGAGTYTAGSNVNLTATASAGYHFVSWVGVNSEVLGTEPTYSFVMPSSDVTITANFEAIGYNVVVAVEPQGSGEVVGAGTYTAGSNVNLTATASAGYHFVSWVGVNSEVLGTEPTYSFVMPSSDVTITANFEAVGYNVVVAIEPQGSGEVVGAGTYTAGSNVNLTATASAGYHFVSWVGVNSEVLGTEPTYSFVMPSSDVTITANFEAIGYNVTFVVTDSDSNNINDALITFNNVTYDPGIYDVGNYLPGSYEYTVSKTGFVTASGTVVIVDQAVIHTVSLDSIVQLYQLTFKIMSAGAALQGANISIDEHNIFTDSNGSASVSLANGEYYYTITKEGYSELTNSVTIEGEDKVLEIEMFSGLGTGFTSLFNIYPNPVVNELVIERGNNEPSVIEIFSSAGQLLRQLKWDTDNIVIDVSGLRSGIHFIKVSGNKTRAILKVVKQ